MKSDKGVKLLDRFEELAQELWEKEECIRISLSGEEERQPEVEQAAEALLDCIERARLALRKRQPEQCKDLLAKIEEHIECLLQLTAQYHPRYMKLRTVLAEYSSSNLPVTQYILAEYSRHALPEDQCMRAPAPKSVPPSAPPKPARGKATVGKILGSLASLFTKPVAAVPPPPPSFQVKSFETPKPDSAVELHRVRFSVISPRAAKTSSYIPVDVLMYEDAFRELVEARVGKENREVQSGYHVAENGCKVKVVLSSKDLVIEDCEEERVWCGKYLEFGFVLTAPETAEKPQVLVIASVYLNGVIATKLKFFLDITSATVLGTQREDINSVFVSYSHSDKKRVLSIVQGMQTARPDLDVFIDVESLRRNELWEEAIKKAIDERNVLYLCWSKSASESQWVDFEWRYALEQKGENHIEPISIDPPEFCPPPPPELSKKHFGDPLSYAIKALDTLNE